MSLDEIEAELQSRREQAKLAAGGTSSEQAQLIAADITAAAASSEQAQLVAAAEAAAAEAAAAEAAAIAAAAAEASAIAAATAATQALAEAESMAAEAASQQPQVESMTTAEIENELFQRTGDTDSCLYRRWIYLCLLCIRTHVPDTRSAVPHATRI